ncbi:hypothetical protein RJT34_20392 [Clitoria ternatea]|uniref:Uncharacterized protein n=1 Tax=Clitoria ternatea TaxID=43366 RepID=A0AAN9IT28_CLITE
MLENEEKNENAEFHVKEVQYIQDELHASSGQHSHSLVLKRAAVSQNAEGVDLSARPGSLVSRLTLDPLRDSDFVPLPVQLLRKYITYAKSFAFLRMTKPAAKILRVLPKTEGS